MIRILKITMPDGGILTVEPNESAIAFTGDLGDVEIGDKFLVEVAEMTDADFAALPDYSPP